MCNYTLAVIIPNYNKEKYINECFNSILKQTRIPDEIIVVDDVSSDNSREIIERYAKFYPFIKPVYLSKNGGASKARNTGIDIAESEYVTFLDSDDYYYSNKKLENEMNLVQKYREKGKDILAYSATVLVEDDNTMKYLPVRHRAWYLQGDIYKHIVAQAKKETNPRDFVVKKSIVKEVGGYCYPKDFYEDLDFAIRLARRVPFYCTLEYGSAYRYVPVGLSNKELPIETHLAAIDSITAEYKKDMTAFERLQLKIYYRWWRIERYPLRLLRKIITGI